MACVIWHFGSSPVQSSHYPKQCGQNQSTFSGLELEDTMRNMWMPNHFVLLLLVPDIAADIPIVVSREG